MAKDLTTADDVKLPSEPACVQEVGEPTDARFFHLVGLLLSDRNGNLSALKLNDCLESPSQVDDYARYVHENWGERAYDDDYVNEAMLTNGPSHADDAGDTLTATLTNRRLLSRARAYIRTDSSHHRLTDDAFTAGLAAQKHLLRGLFTADGVVTENTIELRAESLGLLEDVQLILLGFGVQSHLHVCDSSLVTHHSSFDDNSGNGFPHSGGLPGTRPDPLLSQHDQAGPRGGSGPSFRGSAHAQRHGLRIDPGSLRLFAQHVAVLPGKKLAGLAEVVGGAIASQDQASTLRAMFASAGNWDRVATLTHLGPKQVFDLTEPVTSSFVANGITVHNCSEYMFLDDTACNLASLNVLTFFDAESRTFDVESYKHAIRLWTIVLEVSVLMASFPSEEIAKKSYKFRTLGLGYANLGAMLMQAGIAYDSDKGRAICGALTAILTGESYAASAEMSRELGAFPGFDDNAEHMLRVMRNHRRAAYDVAHNAPHSRTLGRYERLDIEPVGIDASQFADTDPMSPRTLLHAAQDCWDRALHLGEKHGYRNAQTTVIAPTGTIGLLMDCDTTGVEPDFALVKFKKLAGGGYFKIANQSLAPALRNLGYESGQVHEILQYVMGTLTLHGAPHVSYDRLRAAGFTDAELEKIEQSLPSMFEISFAFSPWTLGTEVMNRLGISESEWQSPGFNLLRKLGFSKKQIDEANDVICGRGTVEGAPHLKEEHLSVFDCANKCGKTGCRYIHVDGHIKMMAAAQPFISGAISKTINLPNEASVEDIKRSYELSWKLGLKANALYRDGSKLSQPLNVKSDEDLEDKSDAEDEEAVEAAREEVAADVALAASIINDPQSTITGDNIAPAHVHTIEKIVERIVERPLRRRLPDTRRAITHKFDVAGHEGYITAGLYEDGQPGEVFIRIAKEGSTIGGLMDTIATLVSVSLQYGVPVESLVRKFEHVRFEPSGMTRNADIPIAKSLVDYIFRYLAMEFVPGYRAANAPQRPSKRKPAEIAAATLDSIELPPSPGTPGEGGGEGLQSAERKGNGHGPRIEPDTAQSFDYDSPAAPKASADTLATSGQANLRLAIVADPLSQQGSNMQADAPACDVCGSITVRSGTCYKCLNCGNSMGCS
jgi:ribonucleoside-diphosphate reductase alpha chain